MINFSPAITIEIGSVASICCSVFCVIIFYYWYRQSKQKNDEMCGRIDKLSDAFCKLTDMLMEENNDEPREDAGIHISPTTSPGASVLGVWNTRTQDPLSDDNEGKDRGEMPDVSPNL